MNAYAFSSLVTALTSLLLGVFVWTRSPKGKVNKIFLLLSLAISIWSWGVCFTVSVSDSKTAVFWGKIIYLGAIPIIPLFLHFIFTLLDKNREKRKILILVYIIATIFLVADFGNLVVQGVTTKPPSFGYKYDVTPGKLLPFFFLLFISIISYAHYELFKSYQTSYGLKRNQLKYVLWASIIGFLGGTTTFLPVFNINIYPFGNYFVSLYVLVLAYAIAKHRLMDIDIIIKKGATYVYASLLLLIPLFVMVMIGQLAAFRTIDFSFSVFVLGTIVTAAYFFPKVKLQAEKTVEQFIFKNKYDYKKTIRNSSKAMVAILDINELCKNIITTTTDALMVENASIFIFDDEKNAYVLRNAKGPANHEILGSSHKNDFFFKWAERHKEIFVREELERCADNAENIAVAKSMGRIKAEIGIPLITKKKLIGIVTLGMKDNKEMYTHEDLELLATLANNATIAIENAQLYENLKKTKKIMLRAERLASLGTLSAGLAHEIRNPLVAIKTFTQLLPERFDDEEFRNHFLSVTAGEIDRISTLVSELLEFARPSEPFFQQENINTILEKMIFLINTEAKKKELQIEINLAKELPPVTIDKEQIKQVFLNILLNAIQATPEKGKISIQTRKQSQNKLDEFIQIEITDTGTGIPPQDLDKIFTPFFTTRHKGSGLGLPISHQIIQEHEGTITVQSDQHKGTIFTISIPVNPLIFKGNKGSERYN